MAASNRGCRRDPAAYECSPVYRMGVDVLPYAPRYREDFNTHTARATSFPLNQTWPARLRVAENGFYADELDPRVIACFFCGLRLLHPLFTTAGDLKTEHIRWSPKCVFARLVVGLDEVLQIIKAHHKALGRARHAMREFAATCTADRADQAAAQVKLAMAILAQHSGDLGELVHENLLHKKMAGQPMKMEYILQSLRSLYPIEAHRRPHLVGEGRADRPPPDSLCGKCGCVKRTIKLHPCSTTIGCMQCAPFPIDYCLECGRHVESIVSV